MRWRSGLFALYGAYCGSTLKLEVWMFLSCTPMRFKAANTPFMADAFALSASAAVAACVVTPAEADAESGGAVTSPWPSTVMVRDGSAAKSGLEVRPAMAIASIVVRAAAAAVHILISQIPSLRSAWPKLGPCEGRTLAAPRPIIDERLTFPSPG